MVGRKSGREGGRGRRVGKREGEGQGKGLEGERECSITQSHTCSASHA